MSIFDELKAKADVNGDGKLRLADLEELKDRIPEGTLTDLKAKADMNDDGKINIDDVKDFDFGDAKGAFGDIKSALS